MHIESGTTRWWRNRHLMFLAMFLAFAAYFAYDGLYAWPAENVKWAAQAMGVAPEAVHPDPRVRGSALPQLKAALDELQKQGSPTLPAVVERLKPVLGQPVQVRPEEYFWVGPAMYVKASMQNNRINVEPVPSTEHAESSIRGQKWFAVLLLAAAMLVLLRLIRVLTTRVVVDDSGFHYNSQATSWDAMTGLRIDDYNRKGWVYLEYTAGNVTRSFRLDSFHIEKFNDILAAICERKGFASPLAAAETTGEAREEEKAPPQA